MSVLVFVLIFCLLFSLWGFWTAVRPPKIISNKTPEDFGLDYEKVSFKTEDDITLKGWFIPCSDKETKKTIIFLHGYPADKGNLLSLASSFSKDYNLFLFDFRYFGESEGFYTTAGAEEVKDLKAAVKFLRTKDIKEIGIWGFSMGGAVALMAANEIPEIQAIVSASSYASLDRIVYQLYQVLLLRYPLAWGTCFWGMVLTGMNPYNVLPAKSVKEIDIPVLVTHSRNDKTVPFKNALLLQRALKDNSSAEFWFYESLLHGQFTQRYQKRIRSFFKKTYNLKSV